MPLYSVEDFSTGSLHQKTLRIEGSVVSSRKSNLQSILLDAILSCDHLIVNLEKVTEFDGSLILLLCSLHQTTQHICKTLTIQVKESAPLGNAFEKSLCPRSMNCLLEHCFLREQAYEKISMQPGNH